MLPLFSSPYPSLFSFLCNRTGELTWPAHIWQTSLETLFIWEDYYYGHNPWERTSTPRDKPLSVCVCVCTLESHSSSNDFCHCLLYEAGNHFKDLRVSEGVADSATGHLCCYCTRRLQGLPKCPINASSNRSIVHHETRLGVDCCAGVNTFIL